MPDFFGPFSRCLIAPLWAAKDRSPYLRILRELERSQYLSLAEIRERQLAKLRRIVAYAYEQTPFFRDRLTKAGYRPGDTFSFAEYATLPALTKEEIQENPDRLRPQELPQNKLIANLTGGSTGRPLAFYHDPLRLESRKAATWRHNRWAGYRIGDKAAVLWGMPRDISAKPSLKAGLRKRLLDRTLVLDTSSITEEKMRTFHAQMWRFRPRVILAYANSLYVFAEFLEQAGLTPPPVVGIITSAEILFPEYRTTIERVFKAPIFNRYGCRELSIIASECAEHNGLHINAENLHLEIERPPGRQNDDAPGEIILTDLENRGTPFLRYRIEDMGRLVDGDCPCGRGLPRLELAAGRTTEFLVSPSGKLVSGAALTVLLVAKTPGVRQAQLVQNQPDELLIRVVRDNKTPFDEQAMRRKVGEFFGEQVHIAFEYPDNIPRTASGKYRFSISRVVPEFLRGTHAHSQ